MVRTASVTTVDGADGLRRFAELIREYVASLPFELDFQDLDRELDELAVEYGAPGGASVLALLDGTAVGCVGVRRFDDHAGELKRMYVRPEGRHLGLGRALLEAAVGAARAIGYDRLRLDTSAELEAANRLYAEAGFVEIPAYRPNPLASARYLELDLSPDPHR